MHADVQPPQSLNVPCDTQRSPHERSLDPHAGWQVPPTQVSSGLQTVPQAPQLLPFVGRNAQLPVQLVSPGGQVMVHAPLTQTSPCAQSL
jgi:hypothetical protein